MNTKQLRQSVKEKWLNYYRDNREWIARLATWGNYKGQRRPSSSFILASLSVLEPELPKMLPMLVDLNNDPDRIISALGLNFNPEIELNILIASEATETNSLEAAEVKHLLPGKAPSLTASSFEAATPAAQIPQLTETTASSRSVTDRDSDCRGTPNRRHRE